MNIAKEFSTWSKDPSTQIGAIAVRDNNLLAQGYNGLPKGMPDTDEYLADREKKYEYIIHAEENLILNAAKNGVSLNGSTVYVYGLAPCSRCAGKLVTAGVDKIIFTAIKEDPRWVESQKRSAVICNFASVSLHSMTENSTSEVIPNSDNLEEAVCNGCGHPKSNHPFRHPFVAASPGTDDWKTRLRDRYNG